MLLFFFANLKETAVLFLWKKGKVVLKIKHSFSFLHFFDVLSYGMEFWHVRYRHCYRPRLI